MRCSHLVPPLAAGLLFAPTAVAQPIIAQTSGLANPDRVIVFGANLFPNFTNVSTEFAGIVVAHARYFTTGVSNNLVGGFLTNDFSGPPDTLRIRFTSPIRALSFVYHQIGTSAPSSFRALYNGTVVDSFVNATKTLSNIALVNNAASSDAHTIFAGNTYATSTCATNQAVNVTYDVIFS